MGDLTTDFALADFACKDGTAVPAELHGNARALAANLQVLRDALGTCLFINSAYRTPRHNAVVGGSASSRHVTCEAADITADTLTASALADAVERLIAEGRLCEGGVGRYAGFVHYDIRGTRARW